MVIVFVIDYYNSTTDGTIITAWRFREELERKGHTVRVVSYGVEGQDNYALEEHHMPILSQFSKKFNVTYAKFDKNVLFDAFTGADVAHLFLPFQLQRKALKLAKKMNVPVTAAFHVHPENFLRNGGINYKPLQQFVFWYFKKTFYNKINHIHCPSLFTAKELKAHKYKGELHVISNGVSPNFTPEIRNHVNENDRFRLLMVGRFAAEKRQDLLIKAVKESKYRDIIEIVFAGQGPLRDKLEKEAEGLKNKPFFGFLTQDELLKEIAKADLYIHAADVEIEGISCIEAISCGLVPIISNAEKSAAKQFAIDDRCLFEAGDHVSLKEKIEYFIENRDELDGLAARYTEFSKGYSLADCVSKAERMFERAVGAQKHGF
jgi:glycosyltransferase involved in cell wall biosynthesis